MNYKKKSYETEKKDYSVITTHNQGNIKLTRSVIMYSLRYDKPKDGGQCDEGARMREHASRKKVRCCSLNNRQKCTHYWEFVCDRQFVCCVFLTYLNPYSVTSQVPLMGEATN
jgi:hypothetical protein